MEKEKFLAPVHFDADGIRTIGKRMGTAWREIFGKDTPAKSSQQSRPSRPFYFGAKGNDEANGCVDARTRLAFFAGR